MKPTNQDALKPGNQETMGLERPRKVNMLMTWVGTHECSLRDHQCSLRDHKCGCMGGNRYVKGGFKKIAEKAIN